MIREAQCERDDRQRRGSIAFRREDRPAGDEEVRDAMNAAVRIHDAAFRVNMHSRHSELMPAPLENAGAPAHEVVGERLEPADAEALELLADDLLAAQNGPSVEFAQSPVDPDTVDPELVAIMTQCQPAVGVRRLLRLALENIPPYEPGGF